MNVVKTKITAENFTALNEKFINVVNAGLPFFKFYEKRGYAHVLKIKAPFLYSTGDIFIGYGHLDDDTSTIWLGITIKPEYRGKGYGKAIIRDLIKEYLDYSTTKKLRLAVNKNNKKAIQLYYREGFILESIINQNCFMIFKPQIK